MTRNERSLQALKSTIMAGVKPLVVKEQDLRVRKALAQLIVSLAAHDYLVLEGGEAMIDFIVTNRYMIIIVLCVLQTKSTN